MHVYLVDQHKFVFIQGTGVLDRTLSRKKLKQMQSLGEIRLVLYIFGYLLCKIQLSFFNYGGSCKVTFSPEDLKI